MRVTGSTNDEEKVLHKKRQEVGEKRSTEEDATLDGISDTKMKSSKRLQFVRKATKPSTEDWFTFQGEGTLRSHFRLKSTKKLCRNPVSIAEDR
jgi:hypothetical protein